MLASRLGSVVVLTLGVLSQTGCGSSPDDAGEAATPDAASPDAGGDAAPRADGGTKDAPSDAPFEVAAHPVPSEMPAHRGVVLAHPKIVSIYFANDAVQKVDDIERFHGLLPGSDWWKAVTGGFGIGDVSHPAHLVLAASAPDEMDDDGVLAAIVDHIADGSLPYPDADTLYAIFLPPTTTLHSVAGDSCVNYGGFHTQGIASNGDGGSTRFAYAVLPQCQTDLTDLTIAASHEYIEAATDPYPFSAQGYTFDQGEPWSANLGEVADVCNGYVSLLGDFTVTRSWSLTAAREDRDPCQPTDESLTYFNAAIVPESLTVTAGDTAEFELRVFSAKPMAQTIALSASSGMVQHVPLGFKLSQTTAKNGDVVKLSVHVPSSLAPGSYAFQVDARRGVGNQHFWGGSVSVE